MSKKTFLNKAIILNNNKKDRRAEIKKQTKKCIKRKCYFLKASFKKKGISTNVLHVTAFSNRIIYPSIYNYTYIYNLYISISIYLSIQMLIMAELLAKKLSI